MIRKIILKIVALTGMMMWWILFPTGLYFIKNTSRKLCDLSQG